MELMNPKLPPATAIEAQSANELAPLQSRAEPRHKSAAPFPSGQFWSHGAKTVETWEPSNDTESNVQKVKYDYQAQTETSRTSRGWAQRQ